MKKKILIVDDEKGMGSYLSRKLAMEDFDPLVANDGLEGLKMLAHQKVEAIVIDAVMPAMDGYALCQKLKESKLLSDIPIVVCTADADNEREFRKLGIDDYIVKPFKFEDLSASLNRVISQISHGIKFKKIIVQTNQTEGIQAAIHRIRECGFRIDAQIIPEDGNLIEEAIRNQPDIMIFNALRKNENPEILISSLKSYVELRGIKVIPYVDRKSFGPKEQEFEEDLKEVKAHCTDAGADGWMDSLDRESFLELLFEYCR